MMKISLIIIFSLFLLQCNSETNTIDRESELLKQKLIYFKEKVKKFPANFEKSNPKGEFETTKEWLARIDSLKKSTFDNFIKTSRIDSAIIITTLTTDKFEYSKNDWVMGFNYDVEDESLNLIGLKPVKFNDDERIGSFITDFPLRSHDRIFTDFFVRIKWQEKYIRYDLEYTGKGFLEFDLNRFPREIAKKLKESIESKEIELKLYFYITFMRITEHSPFIVYLPYYLKIYDKLTGKTFIEIIASKITKRLASDLIYQPSGYLSTEQFWKNIIKIYKSPSMKFYYNNEK